MQRHDGMGVAPTIAAPVTAGTNDGDRTNDDAAGTTEPQTSTTNTTTDDDTTTTLTTTNATVGPDSTGATGTTTLNASFAYRIPLGDDLKLSAGLQAGAGNWRGDWTKLTLENPTDVAFQNNLNRWLPNFGAGIYLYAPRFYAGFGVPSILEYDLRKTSAGDDAIFSKNYRHYYTTVGAAFPLGSESVVLRPSALLKTTGFLSGFRSDAAFRNICSPTELDLDLSGFFF